MLIQPDYSTCSIVLVGQFNPAIFHPAWFYSKGVELETSSIDDSLFTFSEVARFSIDTRSYFIQKDRFQIETNVAPWVEILDITLQIFREHLHHTPIRAFGINRNVHFKLPSESSRVKLGRTLAPIEPWGEYGRNMDSIDRELIGGLQSLVMRQISTLNSNELQTNVKIEPSIKINDETGVYMEVNAHHSLNNLPKGYGSEEAMTLLVERFDFAMEEAEVIIETIMREGKKQ